MEQNNMEQEAQSAAKPKDRMLAVSILIAAVLVSGSLVFAAVYKPAAPAGDTGQTPQQPTYNTSDIMKIGPTDAILGNANAPVTLVEYGDYQCPFCASFFANTQSQLIKNYVDTGKVKMIFRNFVVNDRTASDHESHNAALAAACAKDQNKFWQFHDAVYSAEVQDEMKNPAGAENNGNLTRALFLQLAGTVGMDKAQFASCYDSGKYAAGVQAESDAARADGVDATPTFFANGAAIVGAQPYDQFQATLDALLK